MRVLSTLIATQLLCIGYSLAQTYSNCNPLTSGGCPADSALGKSVNIDFTSGASDSFTVQGSPAPSYGPNGAQLTVAGPGNSPQLTSRWYIMFGRVDVVLKSAPGAGIVSSFVMQSDDLDEIDWEWLGADDSEVQTNYFGKGITGSYNRGAFNPAANSQTSFRTYTVIWTADQIIWQVDGQTVRVLTAAAAEANQYPQTPMQLKVGIWSGGDSSNAPGTIQWARGPTDYSKAPFSMYVKSISVQDYSSGSQYKYNGNSGAWTDIVAVGGKVNPSGSGSAPASSNNKPASSVVTSAPPVTSTSSGQPIPFQPAGGNSVAIATSSQSTVSLPAQSSQLSSAASVSQASSNRTITTGSRTTANVSSSLVTKISTQTSQTGIQSPPPVPVVQTAASGASVAIVSWALVVGSLAGVFAMA